MTDNVFALSYATQCGRNWQGIAIAACASGRVRLVLCRRRLRDFGRTHAFLGEADEFLGAGLAPHLFGNVPVEPRMRAQTLGKLLRIWHGCGPSVATLAPCTHRQSPALIKRKGLRVVAQPHRAGEGGSTRLPA